MRRCSEKQPRKTVSINLCRYNYLLSKYFSNMSQRNVLQPSRQ
jgi:hypothetical protein